MGGVGQAMVMVMVIAGTLQRLGRVIPKGMARQMAYTGEPINADVAKRTGLVNEVYHPNVASFNHHHHHHPPSPSPSPP